MVYFMKLVKADNERSFETTVGTVRSKAERKLPGHVS